METSSGERIWNKLISARTCINNYDLFNFKTTDANFYHFAFKKNETG